MTHSGRVTFEPVVFTSAAAAITEGERLKEKKTIKDYNYSVVNSPQIGAEAPVSKMPLTQPQAPTTIQL
jgi:hypothetical protein